MTPIEFDQVASRVEAVIDLRRAGIDQENQEHRLQAALEREPGKLELVDTPFREFPTFRNARRAYIDFLGVDSGRRVRVVEVKRGSLETIVLQGLEYWIWTRRHRWQLGEMLGSDATLRPCIDFVVLLESDQHSPMDKYSQSLLRTLVPWIDWRIVVVRETQGSFQITRFDPGILP
jgi:hypothetical protein